MNTHEIHDVFVASQAGQLTFPEVVRRMLAAGVESYFCYLVRAQETFYGADGSTHVAPMSLQPATVSSAFSQAGCSRPSVVSRPIRFAIRSLSGSQQQRASLPTGPF
jgi:hypothetical protein